MSIQTINNLSFKAKLVLFTGAMMISGAQTMADVLNPVIGNLLYEENFNTLDSAVWNSIDGDGCEIGLCGWGNMELEHYRPGNVSVVNVPFETATKALAIQARRETYGTRSFTSGKVTTANKLEVKYGMIEFRMSTPQVGTGLWPAGWMLGTSLATWPAKGELDIMEMGHSAAGMANSGLAGSDINSYTAANAIFYATSACTTGNPSCAASTAWQTKNAYVASTPLTNRFVTYRMYWTDSQIRFTVIDNNIEHDMYATPIPINAESSEFNAPFYFLFNLAVGGQFTDAATPAQVTAPLPGTMYIDYIRVYQLDGLGEVKLGSQVKPEAGTFGVFTDNTSTANKQEAGVTSDVWVWNTTSVTAGTTLAYEGTNVIAWKYTAPQWFGGGIASRQAHDMSNFINGNLKFRIKIPANVGFKVGVSDTYTNENYINFPANTTTYGLVRNGEWAQATVPVSTLRGSLVALQSMSALFNIVSLDPQPTSNFEMAIDDIVWECGASAACQTTSTSSSIASSIKSSVASSMKSSVQSSIAASSIKSSVANSAVSSIKSSVRSSLASSMQSSIKSSVKSSVANSSSVPATNGYTVLTGTSVKFFANNAAWADIHYTVNNGGQQNIRMTHNADNSNTYTLTGIPAGALVKFNYTIGQATGAIDTAWVQFTMVAASSSSMRSSVASSIKSSVASSVRSSIANSSSSAAASYGYTKLTTTSVKFYSNNAPWADIHYTVNGGGQQNIRMIHNADNSNTYTLTNIPVGAVVRYSYTIGQTVGAVDTVWMQFTM
jgi:beta-glucanase (GH16 family)